jgi:hypothetical protein
MLITIKPACAPDGTPLVVRDPVTMQPLNPEGEEKEKSSHWIRRIAEGDVILVSPASQPAAKPAAKTAVKE